MTHELKTYPEYFQATWDNKKNFEVRFVRDRIFKVGDSLLLREYHPERRQYTGRSIFKTVTYILTGFEGLRPGWIVMSLESLAEASK